ncbi:DUF947-domain-containing protein [Clavulina sp. PMI_390]|nr:DUF947-domain-containing protein [Clavulina sp. PMI_390]
MLIDLSSLSFGALAKANRMLEAESGSSSEEGDHNSASEDDARSDESSDSDEDASLKPKRIVKAKVKRPDKNAPMEVSSKKPVSRRRTVVEAPKIERRDPRFSSLSGSFDQSQFSKSYSFITGLQETEVGDLKTSLSRARKLLANSPAHLRDDRAAEVTRLERALKRTESHVEREKRERRQREVLGAAKKAEQAKQAAGKGIWHMKKSEKSKLLNEARFQDLAEQGKGAVRKAIAKRQLKVSQKEKRSRPGPIPTSKPRGDKPAFQQRRNSQGGGDSHRNKRPRFG